MVGKKILVAMMFLLVLASVSALPITIDEVEFDEDELDATSTTSVLGFDRDQTVDVKVRITATDDVDDVQIEAYLRGYDHDDRIEDITDVFDMEAGETRIKKLQLTFPDRLDKDQYKLRIRVEDRDGDSTVETYELLITNEDHSMKIRDVDFSPSSTVVAGRSLLTSVRFKNYGDDDTDGIKVKINIPELGLSAADYIDELDEDDSVSSEELYIRIPSCTPGGVYEAKISIVYDDGDESEYMSKMITVIEDELCAEDDEADTPKTIITVGPTTQDVVAGEAGVLYPLTLSNAGKEAKTYVVTADGYQTWADLSISPQNIVNLQPGDAQALFIQLAAKEDAAPGEHMFAVSVTSGAEVIKQFTLKATVQAAEEEEEPATSTSWTSIKRVLEIGLVVLVVLLVILGLIIGFSRLRGNDDDFDDEDSKSETYY